MSGRPLLAAFRCRCTLLIRFRRPPLMLRAVSCRAAIQSLAREQARSSLSLATGLPGAPG